MTRQGGDGLRVEVLNSPEGLAGLQEEWEALRAAAGAGVFMSWEWMATWWKHYGADRQLYLIAVRDAGGGLVGVAPLMWGTRRYRGLPVRAIELLGAGSEVSPDLMDILALPRRADEVGRAVWAHLAGRASWDLLMLDNVEAGAAAASALAMAARGDGLVGEIKAKASCPFIMLPATWEAYLAGRGSATRYDLRRKARALRRGHDVKLERVEEGQHLGTAMEALFDLHAARWQTRGETGSFDRDPRNRAFHQAMAAAAQRRGWLRLYFLSVDGRRVAAFIGYEVGGRLSYYQLGWDPAWGRWSVGSILIAEVLRDAIARGVKEFDFLRRAEGYKGRLADEARGTVALRVWGRSWRAGAHRALYRAAGWARRRRPAGPAHGSHDERPASASTAPSWAAPDRWKAVAVRSYRPGDEEAMAALYNAAHGHLAGFIERSGEHLRWFLSRPGLDPEGISVAERAGRLAGYAVVYSEGEVAELAADPADPWPVTDALLAGAEAYVASRGGDRVRVLLPPGYAAHDVALWDRGYGLGPESLREWVLVDAVGVVEAILGEKLREGAGLPLGRYLLRVARGHYVEPPPPVIHVTLTREAVKVRTEEGPADVTIALEAVHLADLIFGGGRPAAAWASGRVRIRPWRGVARGLALLRALQVTDPVYSPSGDCR